MPAVPAGEALPAAAATAFAQVADELVIRNLLSLYALSLDRRRYDGLRELFCESIEADFTRAGRKEVYRGPAAGWITNISAMVAAMDGTHHQLDNLRIELRGDAAQASCSFYAIHVLRNDRGSDRYDVAGFYDFELLRQAAGWRVCKYVATRNQSFGNPHIFKLAAVKAGLDH